MGFFHGPARRLARLDDRISRPCRPSVAWPTARVVRWGGCRPGLRPLWLDEAWCQVDIWGGSKAEVSAWVAGLMRALVDERLVAGEVPTVAGITFGMLQDSPDSTFEPARPHFRFDLALSGYTPSCCPARQPARRPPGPP